MSIYGPILDGGRVEEAAKATLQAWMPAYLAEVERQTARTPGVLPQIRSWVNTPSFDKWPEDQLPCAVLICPGTTGEPVRDGGGMLIAAWELRVATVVSASTAEATADLAKLYTAAARACLLQKATLGGFAEAVDWTGEAYEPIPVDMRRSLAAGEAVFNVYVTDVTDASGGPTQLPANPLVDPGDWPPGTATVTVDRSENP